VYYSIKSVKNQWVALHIIKTLVLYIIKPTVFLYTPKGVMRYKCDLSHLMIYTLLHDDIPSLPAWIKKLPFRRTRVFWNRSKNLIFFNNILVFNFKHFSIVIKNKYVKTRPQIKQLRKPFFAINYEYQALLYHKQYTVLYHRG